MAAKKFKVLADLSDAEGQIIALAGEVVSAKKLGESAGWLLEQGHITEEVA